MYDVAIVGARCAGSALALMLAREGLNVLVIDRTTFPSDTMSAISFIPPACPACGGSVSLRTSRRSARPLKRR